MSAYHSQQLTKIHSCVLTIFGSSPRFTLAFLPFSAIHQDSLLRSYHSQQFTQIHSRFLTILSNSPRYSLRFLSFSAIHQDSLSPSYHSQQFTKILFRVLTILSNSPGFSLAVQRKSPGFIFAFIGYFFVLTVEATCVVCAIIY